MTAGWHKIWNPDRRIGFLAQAEHLQAQLAAGGIAPEKIRETGVVVFNNQLDAAITGVFMVVVWIVLLDAMRTWNRTLRGPGAAPARVAAEAA
jgi:carbon starvation protein